MKQRRRSTSETGWSFALLNGRLAEIYFDIGKGLDGISGRCHVLGKEFKTKREQKMIAADTKKYQLVYRNKKYRKLVGNT